MISAFYMWNSYTVEHHLSGLIGTASHPHMQKIRKIGSFFENCCIGSFKFGCLQYVPASKTSDHAWFEVLEAITLYCTQLRTEGRGVQPPPPEIPKALQNRAKLNSIVKTVKKLLNFGHKHPKMFGKKAVEF